MSGRGRGRGRGNTLPAWMTNNRNNGGADDDSGGRGGGGDQQNQFTSDPINNFVREENNATANIGMGRGRGRGRGRGGVNSNRMSSNDNGPSGNQNGPEDEALNSLLAKAMQKQQQQQKQQTSSQNHQSSSLQTNDTSNNNGNSKATNKSKEDIEQEKIQKQRKIEEDEAKEAAKRLEEEARRLEQLREEEERRQLRALVGDVSDNEYDQSITDGDNSYAKRNRRTEDEDGGDDDFFEFETEEQKEEKARKLREERRRKLRKLEQDKSSIDVIDKPRNVAGIIQSEMQDANAHSTTSTKMDVVESQTNEQSNTQEQNDSDDDSFDMFAATDNATPVPTQQLKNAAMSAVNIKNKTSATSGQECDDVEGYYKANIGEIITLPKEIGGGEDEDDIVRFRVLGIIGKGVFSSVIKCVEETIHNGANQQQDNATSQRVVAMKIIRNNEVMAKAALKEMRILRMLCNSSRTKSNQSKNSKKERDSNDDEVDKEEQERRERENHNIVRLLEVDNASKDSSGQSFATPPPEFRSHCIFLFEYLPHNLREVLNKFGKNVGINLTAVKSYARQLLCALRHLEKHKVVHSDIKPDNILVSANFSTLKLCDFGSAFFETDHDNDPTPYLVSRFYRPPEVILGLEYDRMVDLWSVGVTLAELYTGSVLFPGNSNNDMLKRFMDTMGPFSFKMVKRHAASYSKMGLEPHFEVGNTGGIYEFRKHDLDKVTGDPIVRIVNVLTAKTEASLSQVLLKASKGSGGVSERVEVLKFANFLNRCLALDPARRLSVRNALQHDFFMKKKKKEENTA